MGGRASLRVRAPEKAEKGSPDWPKNVLRGRRTGDFGPAPPPRSRPERAGGTKVPGRRRGLAVDVLGLVIAVVVPAASAHDNAAGVALLDKVAADTDTVQRALVDQGFRTAVVDHGRKVGIDVEVVERNPAGGGFVPRPKRWAVERVNGIMMLHRRLVRDTSTGPPPPGRGCTGP